MSIRRPSLAKGREDHFVSQLATVRPDVALREYIVNGIDNVYQEYIPSVRINVDIDKRRRKITITDNGRGMSKGTLDHIIDNIGDSLKRYDYTTIGEKGFGILSFYGMGKDADLIVYTRDDSTRPTSVNILDWNRDKFLADAYTIQETDKNPQIAEMRTGTKVLISGISEDVFDQYLWPSKLLPKLNERFHPLIVDGKAKIHLTFRGEREIEADVEPLDFRGEPVIQGEKSSMWYEHKDTGKKVPGNIEVFLWHDPKNINGKIRLYNKGVYVKDIVGIDQFSQFPWNSGRLDGFINENLLELTIHRDEYMPTDSLFEFIKKINSKYNSNLSDIVMGGRDRAENEEAVEIGRRVIIDVRNVYRDLCESCHMEAGKFVKDKKGTSKKVIPTGKDTTGGGGRGPTGSDEGGPGGGNETKTKEEFEEDEKGKKKKVKPSHKNLPELSVRLVEFPEEESHLRSRFDEGFQRIEISKNHEYFIQIRSDDHKKNEYFKERICDEMSWYTFRRLINDDKMDPIDAATFARKLREESYYKFLRTPRRKRK